MTKGDLLLIGAIMYVMVLLPILIVMEIEDKNIYEDE